jgi:hypothetical protein
VTAATPDNSRIPAAARDMLRIAEDLFMNCLENMPNLRILTRRGRL